MIKVLLGFVIGLALGWGGLGLLCPRTTALSRANEEWQRIQPGMTLDQVEATLGRKATYDAKPGEGFPSYAKSGFPEDYSQEHGLQTFLVPGIGPYLLLVAYDRSGRVTFVACTTT